MKDSIKGFESDIQEKYEQNSEEDNIDNEEEMKENNSDEEGMNENNNNVKEEMNENISDADESEIEGVKKGNINEVAFKYNDNNFKIEKIIKFLLDSNLINNKQYTINAKALWTLPKKIDDYMWRCKKRFK